MRIWRYGCLGLLLVCWACAGSASSPGSEAPLGDNGVKVDTTKGSFTLELYIKRSPRAAQAFLRSVRNPMGPFVGRTFYGPQRSQAFHLLLLEPRQTDRTYQDTVRAVQLRTGTVAMTRIRSSAGGLLTNSTVSFEICTWVHPRMDLLAGQYTPLGQIVSGMDVVSRLRAGDKILAVTPVRVPAQYDIGSVPEISMEQK